MSDPKPAPCKWHPRGTVMVLPVIWMAPHASEKWKDMWLCGCVEYDTCGALHAVKEKAIEEWNRKNQ